MLETLDLSGGIYGGEIGSGLRHLLYIRPPQQWEVRVFQIAEKVEGTKGMSVTW